MSNVILALWIVVAIINMAMLFSVAVELGSRKRNIRPLDLLIIGFWLVCVQYSVIQMIFVGVK
jgi:hypothetical protein